MVSQKYIDQQLKKISFNPHGWGRGEIKELKNIILPDEKIYECANGIYDGGFALLVATDVRVLLIDQKPLNYLTVEDLRFDMINELDYSHRLFGARISISSGSKNLKFLSYNQPRLRKLISHVQHCMADSKKKQDTHDETQTEHLEKINEQLQEYLIAQQKQQLELQQQIVASMQAGNGQQQVKLPAPVKPRPELADYLFTRSLLAQHQAQTSQAPISPPQVFQAQPVPSQAPVPAAQPEAVQKSAPAFTSDTDELMQEGRREIFGHQLPSVPRPSMPHLQNAREVYPLTIAYSKLPQALRNREFGRSGPVASVPQSQNLAGQHPGSA